MTEAPAPIRLQHFIVGFTRFTLSARVASFDPSRGYRPAYAAKTHFAGVECGCVAL